MTERRNREKLLDVTERRGVAESFEFREDKANGQVILEGYAATYEPYDVQGGPVAGGWVEQLSQSCFDKTLAKQPDLQLLINHEGTPLARTKSGTLQLSADGHGLRVWASLDASDPDVQRLIPKMKRGDMDEMSFAFRVQDQAWDNTYSHRTINELSLHKGDVSVVNYGMNPGTRAVLSNAVGALAQLSHKELVELRNLDAGAVSQARAVLDAVLEPRADDPKKPYGDVKYADPGYRPDGKKRYPIDTEEHAKAAWSYINMPKNQKGYTAAQVSQIKGRIKSALKGFGVDVNDSDKKALAAFSTSPTLAPNPYASQPLVKGPADPHDEMYTKGPQVGGVDNDRPNLVVGSGAGLSSVDANKGGPAVSKEMCARDMDDTDTCDDDMGSCDSTDDDEDRGMCPGGSACPGASCPEHGSRGYDPLTGEVRDDDGDDDEKPDEGEANGIDLGMAEALDRTISHAYRLAEGNADLRKLLATAQGQLNAMRGITSVEQSLIGKMLDEMRREVGQPDTGSVSDGLAYLRSAGASPVGYRGVLSQDPNCHVSTAADRLARDNARAKAREADASAERAQARIKAAEREAELRAVLERHQAS